MTRNNTSEKIEFHAHELDGEMTLGHGIADCPIEAFDAVRDATDDLDSYEDGDRVAVVEIDRTTDELTDVTIFDAE